MILNHTSVRDLSRWEIVYNNFNRSALLLVEVNRVKNETIEENPFNPMDCTS